jgi:hypothetical protein
MNTLQTALLETDPAEALQVLHAVLRQQAARSAGTVLMWAHQRPEQLMSKFTTLGIEWAADCKCWCTGVSLLESKITQTLDSSSATTGNIIKMITEQLEQSGKWIHIMVGHTTVHLMPALYSNQLAA